MLALNCFPNDDLTLSHIDFITYSIYSSIIETISLVVIIVF